MADGTRSGIEVSETCGLSPSGRAPTILAHNRHGDGKGRGGPAPWVGKEFKAGRKRDFALGLNP
jgi:hypothetical protein